MAMQCTAAVNFQASRVNSYPSVGGQGAEEAEHF